MIGVTSLRESLAFSRIGRLQSRFESIKQFILSAKLPRTMMDVAMMTLPVIRLIAVRPHSGWRAKPALVRLSVR